MSPHRPRLFLPHTSPTALLRSLLASPSPLSAGQSIAPVATTLFVCTDHTSFVHAIALESEIESAPAPDEGHHEAQSQQPSLENATGTTSTTGATNMTAPLPLAELARAHQCRVRFCPTLAELRLALANWHAAPANPVEVNDDIVATPTLIILDAIALHSNDTSAVGIHELSAQGVAATLALAVEAGARERAVIALVECAGLGVAVARDSNVDDDRGDAHDTGVTGGSNGDGDGLAVVVLRGRNVLDVRVPLLREESGKDEVGGECMVRLGDVVGRWFVLKSKDAL